MANQSQINHNTNTESNFKGKAAARRQKNMTSQINKHIIKAKDNDTAIINTAIKLAADERNAMNKTTMMTYDSCANGHYLSVKDRKKLDLPILRVSSKKLVVANGGA